jgi:type IV pilus assembly protein PilW
MHMPHSTMNQRSLAKQHGLTLVELMIAITLGILIVLAMSYMMMNSLQSRNEMIKTSRQIENGRYAMDDLRKEVQLAGFYGSFVPTSTVKWMTPNPCATMLGDLDFDGALMEVPVGLQGYTQNETEPACVTNRLASTDILVVRRTATEHIEIDVNPADNAVDSGITATSLGGAFYLQVSNCPDLAAENPFVVSSDPTQFALHKVAPAGAPPLCTKGFRSEIRRYTTHIYYISTCNDCSGSGDDIPTLKMVEVSPTPVVRPIAEGIQNMQIEYGLDTSGDGAPDQFVAAIDSTVTPTQWRDVVAVKIFLLARNVDRTPGHTDSKTYMVASDGSTVGPFKDAFRRQMYVTTTMAHNIAGRRLQ